MKTEDGFEKNLSEFLELTIRLTEEELEAVDHMIPMTQELFDSIVDKCAWMDTEEFFFRFIDEYPEFLEIHAKQIEEELQ